jgi:hypothetical protein
MDSFTFRRGRALFSSDSPAKLWRVTFEDEGSAGYLYACDRAIDTPDESIMDSMLIYNKAATADQANHAVDEVAAREHLGTIQWSRDGLQCVFYIDGSAQAYVDFAMRQSFCRSNFPNFMEQGGRWRSDSHAWDEAALERFEAGLYA